MGDPDRAVEAARQAAQAALRDGAVSRLQADALEALAQPGEDESLRDAARRTLAGDLSAATERIAAAAGEAAARLEDEAAGSDLEELALAVARLGSDAAHLCERTFDASRPSAPDAFYAPLRWQEEVGAARRHLKQAADLLDDGEPADAVALEVLAAEARLRAAL